MTATDRLSDCCSQCSAVQGGGEAPVLGRPTIRLGELAHAGGGLRLCVLIGLLLLPRQDYTGVPAVLDFAVLLLGANPEAIMMHQPSVSLQTRHRFQCPGTYTVFSVLG